MARNEPRAPFESDRRLSRSARKAEQARAAEQRAAREAAEAAAIARRQMAAGALTPTQRTSAPLQGGAAPALAEPSPSPRRSLRAAGDENSAPPPPPMPRRALPGLPDLPAAASIAEAAAREAALQEAAARETAAREAALREAAAREAALQETAAREAALQETAAREAAAATGRRQELREERKAAKAAVRAARVETRENARAARQEARAAGAGPEENPRRRGAQLRFAGAVLFLVFALCTLVSGAPVLGHGWLVRTLLAGAALVVLAGVGVSLTRDRVSSRMQLGAGVLVAVLTASFAWGAYTSVVIDGRVYLSTSPTARAYHLALELNDDLQQIASYDQLLQYEKADARLHYSEYEPAQAELRALYAKYGALEAGELPSAQFVPIIEHVRAAANFGALALENKEKLITEDDAALEATVVSQRATYTDEVLTAGPQLVQVAELYGVELTISNERGPAE